MEEIRPVTVIENPELLEELKPWFPLLQRTLELQDCQILEGGGFLFPAGSALLL